LKNSAAALASYITFSDSAGGVTGGISQSSTTGTVITTYAAGTPAGSPAIPDGSIQTKTIGCTDLTAGGVIEAVKIKFTDTDSTITAAGTGGATTLTIAGTGAADTLISNNDIISGTAAAGVTIQNNGAIYASGSIDVGGALTGGVVAGGGIVTGATYRGSTGKITLDAGSGNINSRSVTVTTIDPAVACLQLKRNTANENYISFIDGADASIGGISQALPAGTAGIAITTYNAAATFSPSGSIMTNTIGCTNLTAGNTQLGNYIALDGSTGMITASGTDSGLKATAGTVSVKTVAATGVITAAVSGGTTSIALDGSTGMIMASGAGSGLTATEGAITAKKIVSTEIIKVGTIASPTITLNGTTGALSCTSLSVSDGLSINPLSLGGVQRKILRVASQGFTPVNTDVSTIFIYNNSGGNGIVIPKAPPDGQEYIIRCLTGTGNSGSLCLVAIDGTGTSFTYTNIGVSAYPGSSSTAVLLYAGMVLNVIYSAKDASYIVI